MRTTITVTLGSGETVSLEHEAPDRPLSSIEDAVLGYCGELGTGLLVAATITPHGARLALVAIETAERRPHAHVVHEERAPDVQEAARRITADVLSIARALPRAA